MAAKKNPKRDYNRPNIWGMIQNIMIAGMNKGQLLASIFGIVIIILIVKIPNSEIVPFIGKVANGFGETKYVGWFLFSVTAIITYYQNKKLRRSFSEELNRITEEKKRLQEKIHKTNLPTSK